MFILVNTDTGAYLAGIYDGQPILKRHHTRAMLFREKRDAKDTRVELALEDFKVKELNNVL